MKNDPDHKVVLLFSPQRLLTDHQIIESLHIIKSGKTLEFFEFEPAPGELKNYHNALPPEAKSILGFFRHSALREYAATIRKHHQMQRASISFEQYYSNAILRRIHDLFFKLRKHTSRSKWYHRIAVPGGKVKTGPCTFSQSRPQLQFEVVKQQGKLGLLTSIGINNQTFPLAAFNRFDFFLEKENEYLLLGMQEFTTLEWLNEARPEQYAGEPGQFAENILARLETGYPVNRNNLFAQNIIDTIPVQRVLLSEISGSFLVLTPQWLYESFLIEGEWKETYETVRNGQAFVVKRNMEEETAFRKLLENMHPNFSKQYNGYYYLSFADAQKKHWFLKTYHQLLEQNIQVVGIDMLQHFRYSPHKVSTDLSINDAGTDAVTLEFTVSFGEEAVSINELRKIILAGQRAILLKDGSLGILGDEWIAEYGGMLKHGKIKGKQVTVARWMAINETKEADSSALGSVLKKDWWKKWKRWLAGEEKLYELPETLNASLWPYQVRGYEWMRLMAEANAGVCLADDMGLGKTLQTICFLAHQVAAFPAQKQLVVCPGSLVYNWMNELQKFAPHIKAMVYHGSNREFDAIQSDDHQVIITTYGTLRSDIDQIATLEFGIAVIDESHNIKNPAAQITRAAQQLQAKHRVALSGTPVMNNTFDLFSQLSFLLPGMFGSREFFKSEYADPIDRDRDEVKTKALQKLTAPFILRRTKEQVASDLPEKVESIRWCRMGADQMAAYESIKEKVRNSIFLDIKTNGLNSGKLSVINGLLKLRQVCNSCELVKEEDLFTYDSIKTDILVDELQQITGSHKALVFSQFTAMLDLLEKSFTQNGISFCRLDGSTPVSKRQGLVDNFEKDDAAEKVFLLSLKAGNAGLNITAADYVYLFDPWWNEAVQQQAIDRTHRIGQTRNVFAYKMICKDTVEEKIMLLQQRKHKLAVTLIGSEEGFVKALDEDDIAFLFS